MTYENKKKWGGGTAYITEWIITVCAFNSDNKLTAKKKKKVAAWKVQFAAKQESMKVAQVKYDE